MEEKKQTSEKPDKKTSSRKFNKKYLLAIPVIVVPSVIFIAILALLLIKPEIKISNVKAEAIEVETKEINSQTTEYPTLSFDSKHLITFPNGNQIKATSYQIKKEDLQEGENVIKVRGIKDYFVMTLLSKDEQEVKIFVDSTKPSIEVGEIGTYYLLENAKVQITTEAGAKIYVNDEEVEAGTDGSYELKLTNGQNELKIKAVDISGNPSEEKILTTEAFNPAGWQRVNCQKLVFPLNRTKLQEGYTSVGTRLYNTNEIKKIEAKCIPQNINYTESISIQPNGTKFPCSGPCDAYLPYIGVTATKNSVNSEIARLTKKVDDEMADYYTRGSSKAYTSKRGIQGHQVTQEYSLIFQSGDYIDKHFIFAKGDITYRVTMTYTKQTPKASVTTLTNHYNQIVDNMILK